MLPEDVAFLEGRGYGYTVELDAGLTCITISNFPLPLGLQPPSSDLMIRLPPGYPDAQPDMFWFAPFITRHDGRYPLAADTFEPYLGRTWQRFSRHLQPGHWRPGTDGLRGYLNLILRELERSAGAS